MIQSLSNRRILFAPLAALIPAVAAPASAQIVVNTTRDVVDFAGAQQVGDLPGPDGLISFREACTAANNTPGPQAIHFAIPTSPPNEWNGGVATLFMDFSVFLLSDDETTVDFSTQTAFTGDTNPNGNEVGIRTAPITGAPAISVYGNRCVIKGLDRVWYCGYAIRLTGNDNRVIGCTISGALYAAVYVNGTFNGAPSTGNVIGGAQPGEGNILSAGNSGVRIDGPAENNIVIGNTLTGSFYGVEIRTPTCCSGNEARNNRVGGPTVAERNVIAGAGKYGQEGFPDGGQVTVQYSTGNVIEGNYVGVLADGVTIPSPQRGPVGVELRSSPMSVVRNNVIGGIAVTGVNHYAGQRFGVGINVRGDCGGSIIQGNRVGIDPSGTVALPCRTGVSATYWSVNGQPVTAGPVLFGGRAPGEGNTIANSELSGVVVSSRITGFEISGNDIHSNGALGIDLLPSSAVGGVTPNDPLDPDTGGNDLQNFPVLDAASTDGAAQTSISGSFNSHPNESYRVEFFASATADPSGNGEGERFLGSTSVTTDGNGEAAFQTSLPNAATQGWHATATATRLSTSDTSEFSNAVAITGSQTTCPGDANGDNIVNFADLNLVLSNYGQSGAPGSMPGDVTGDGVVNFADLNMVLSNFGLVC